MNPSTSPLGPTSFTNGFIDISIVSGWPIPPAPPLMHTWLSTNQRTLTRRIRAVMISHMFTLQSPAKSQNLWNMEAWSLKLRWAESCSCRSGKERRMRSKVPGNSGSGITTFHTVPVPVKIKKKWKKEVKGVGKSESWQTSQKSSHRATNITPRGACWVHGEQPWLGSGVVTCAWEEGRWIWSQCQPKVAR